MQRLLPVPSAQVDTEEAYALPRGPQRHLRVNMVSSIDGAAAVQGRVGPLSGAADSRLLHELRSLGDALLVGAGTVRAEGYGPLDLTREQQERRVAAGQEAFPRLAVLTRSLEVDLAAPVSPTPRPARSC